MAKELKILLASPRGFCAGVDRAIEIVKKTLIKYGSPVYVRHEIVHNTQVVENLKKLGAIFVEELSEVEDSFKTCYFFLHTVFQNQYLKKHLLKKCFILMLPVLL